MKFDAIYEQTMQNILLESRGITAIYPGGFKPPHRGHYELANAYAKDPDVKEVKIMLGPKVRASLDNDIVVTESMSMKIWEDYYIPHMDGNVIIESAPDPNPVRAAYVYIDLHTTPGDVVTLIASKKDPGDIKRSKDFADKHDIEGGQYYKDDIEVLYYPKDTVEYYTKRLDHLNGDPVSASTMREDAVARDLVNFRTNLPRCAQDRAEDIMDILIG